VWPTVFTIGVPETHNNSMLGVKCQTSNVTGFTLVELLVAVGIFVTLVTVAAGVFISGIRGHRALLDLMAVSDNAGIVLEQMAREIRTGYFFCNTDGSNPCGNLSQNNITFTNYKGERVTYGLNGNSITRTIGSNSVKITADNVQVNKLRFVIGQGSGSNAICNPWRITIVMEVGSAKTNQKIPLQTTISSRVLPREAPGVSQTVINQCSR
jgi:Tfp pilus assembly protein PilW